MQHLPAHEFGFSEDTSILLGHAQPAFLRRETLIDVFDATVAIFGSRRALVFGATSYTYTELRSASIAIAMQLTNLGIGPGERVGVWCDRGPLIHAGMLGTMRVGAAYVPFDRDTPFERLRQSIEDAGITALIVDASTASAAEGLEVRKVLLTPDVFAGTTRDDGIHLPEHDPESSSSLAYIIFTSGSTGRPKGVMVSHAQACHWLRSEHSQLGIRQRDIVYQGFSPAFDMSLEEIWTSFLAGATLVVADAATARDAEAIGALLRRHEVTVLHAVPSLASLIDADVPSLRLLNLGGEAATTTVVERWSRPGLRIVNTYGPTEGTVSCTIGELSPGRPITIGRPLPNYRLYIVDDTGTPLPRGQAGELWIGGPSVANGYVAQPKLTAERFGPDPFCDAASAPTARIYRTGDQAMIAADGEIHFLGRIDGQIKIRGYRVELDEIEQVLCAVTGVQLAAVAARSNRFGEAEIVAFIVPRAGSTLDAVAVRGHLRQQLSPYMMPSHLLEVDDLPRMASGKIDRKRLPLEMLEARESRPQKPEQPLSITERKLLEALAPLFPGADVGATSDFFDELGGHSLLMARFASALRQRREFATVSLRDIYTTRNLRALAATIDAKSAANPPEVSGPKPFQFTSPGHRYALCGLAQAVALLFIFSLAAVVLLTPFFTYSIVEDWTDDVLFACLATIAAGLMLPFALFSTIATAKWLIIGRFRPGEYPLWGAYYFRCWLVRRLLDLIPFNMLANSPLYAPALRLLGARIGHNVHLGNLDIDVVDLLEIGEEADIGNGVLINNFLVEGERFRLAPVRVGRNAYVGSSAVLDAGCYIGERAAIGDMAHIPADLKVGSGEHWAGSPARYIGASVAPGHARQSPSRRRRLLLHCLYTVLSAGLAVCALAPALPIIIIANEFDKAVPDGDFSYLALAPLFGLIYTLLFASIVVAARWLLLQRVKPGSYAVHSLFYVRKWFVDQLFEMSLTVVHSLFATMYLPPFYRLMGAKVGNRSEISTATNVTHDLLEIGDECFVADGVVLGDAQIRNGVMTLRRTHLGNRSFVGNAAVIPDGCNMPSRSLLGVLSVAPDNETPAFRPGSTWFGIPATELPLRETFLNYPESLTFRPSRARWWARLLVETVRILLPTSVLLCSLVLVTAAVYEIQDRYGLSASILSLPLVYLGLVVVPPLVLILALKWLLIGRYSTGSYPMWSPFVWFSEAVTALVEMMLAPLILNHLRGTPFLAWPLRLLGAKIGRRVYIDTTDITEFDMVWIGDGAVLANDCGPQTHLFEDRVMKIGPVTVCSGAVIGARAIPLYDTVMGEGSSLAPQSLLMKGEELPPGTRWSGAPAEPI